MEEDEDFKDIIKEVGSDKSWVPIVLRDLKQRGGLGERKKPEPQFKLRPQLQSRGPFSKSFSGFEYLIESNKRGHLDKILWYSYDTGYDVYIKADGMKTSYSWSQLRKMSADDENITATVKSGFTDYYIVGFYGETAGGRPRWNWNNKFKFGVDAGEKKIKLEDLVFTYIEQEKLRVR